MAPYQYCAVNSFSEKQMHREIAYEYLTRTTENPQIPKPLFPCQALMLLRSYMLKFRTYKTCFC